MDEGYKPFLKGFKIECSKKACTIAAQAYPCFG